MVTQVAAAERDEPVDLVADDLEGEDVDLADLRGRPTVVVVWGSWCVECRADQDEVNEAYDELSDRAHFIGLNVRDSSVDNARAYVREKDVPYASIDANDGSELSAFSGTLTPYTVPAFAVLDAEGRMAASVIGSLPSALTLVELVEEVAADPSGRPARAVGAGGADG